MSQIEMRMRPRIPPMSFADFCATYPPFSIAFDGFVNEGPCFDPTGPRSNFNHHEKVDRLATRSTCAQALMAIRQGLFSRYRNEHGPVVLAYFNDCDEDVCMTWALLKYGYLAKHTMNPALNRLVHMEDMLDATAGAYPFPEDLPMLEKLAWVFEPYRRARLNGEVDRKDEQTFVGIVTDVEHRIMRHIMGDGGSVPLNTKFQTVGGGNGWSMVQEIGAQARTGMFAQGILAYVAMRSRPDGTITYTVGRMSPIIPFDVPKILAALNIAEGTSHTADRWGGGCTIGGSPRVAGSRLSPEEVQRIINDCV